jgi:hypothetical protein
MSTFTERGAHEIAGVEVKAAATVTTNALSGLRRLPSAATIGRRSGFLPLLCLGHASAWEGEFLV